MRTLAALCLFAAAALTAAAAETTVVTFSDGTEGWNGPIGPGGTTYIDTADGNPAPSLRTEFNNFGIEFETDTNTDFLGDYTQYPEIKLSVDVKARYINFFGQDVSRDIIVDLRDYDNPPGGYPWVSVWFNLATLVGDPNAEWQTLSVTIADTSSPDLPNGWGGYGAEDPDTFEPMLPPDRTFASVLAGVDEIAFSTYVPGYFYGFTDFDVAVDNITIEKVPEPASLLLLGVAGLLLRRR